MPSVSIIRSYPESLLDTGTVSEGKFLRLTLAGKPYLLFARADTHHYHNQILAHFLAERNLAHHWEDAEHLIFNEPDLVLQGGGRFRYAADENSLRLWDNSSLYGRFDERELSDCLDRAPLPWDKLNLSIDQD